MRRILLGVMKRRAADDFARLALMSLIGESTAPYGQEAQALGFIPLKEA
jgi:hypothetical protein